MGTTKTEDIPTKEKVELECLSSLLSKMLQDDYLDTQYIINEQHKKAHDKLVNRIGACQQVLQDVIAKMK